MISISDFRVRDRVRHAQNGEGRVVSRDKENVGIRFDSGLVGAYGYSFFERLPHVIALVQRDTPEGSGTAREAPGGSSLGEPSSAPPSAGGDTAEGEAELSSPLAPIPDDINMVPEEEL